MKTSKYISLAKAFTWRILGSISTFIISWYFTKNFTISVSISILEFIGKIALYYIHERLWHNIT